MNGFVDIHTHLLPDVDDGPGSMSQALRLLRMAWADGIRAVILTPHYRGEYKENTPAVLKENFAWLREMVAEEIPGMKLYLGQEIAYEKDMTEAMDQGKVLSMNGSMYVLLEFELDSLGSHIMTGVTETIRCGFIPIVAHVERYAASHASKTLIDDLLDMGVLLQLNADSVLGGNGFGIKRFCHKLLKARKVHFIASDAHDDVRRPPLLRKCFLKVYKKYGAEYAAGLFHDNAQAVIENRIVD